MRLYGREWTRRELEARVGRIEQVGGVRRVRSLGGAEDGTELMLVRTGAGLCYHVCPSRGMDISLAEFGGVPLAWRSAAGEVHPAFYDAEGLEWLRTAAGGLLMTCGLTSVGSPCRDEGEALGLHGRAHHTPAREVQAEGAWHGDDYEIRISGVIEETALFGHHLRLRREIRSRLGENRIRIEDTVENAGFRPAPHMILYHFNFGFPLLAEGTTVEFPSRSVRPREETTPPDGYDRWEAPDPEYAERVYYHEDLNVDSRGWAEVTIRNPVFPLPRASCPLRVSVRWNTGTLPRLVQWKMPGAGAHVLGIEPANCWVDGRDEERRRGTLVMLEPGEALQYELEVEVTAGP